jgi:hypothetical protein
MSTGITAAVTVPRALPVTPFASNVPGVGAVRWTGSETVKSNWSSETDQPAAFSVSTT